ncbi:ABC transporter permease subunit [Mollicutes bacterium LVI A0078]|nr:ABC transporter permease subunit [Mollicutes bacterium LVI A0075]WOO91356.1 ABC transporter permease subunit [Mollicutes bacterium LVI A0078]
MDYNQLVTALGETIYITIIVSILVFLLGLIIGVLLYSLQTKELIGSARMYKLVSGIVNVLRAIPFIILLILLMPFTNLIVGKITGANAAIPALVISVAPMFARLVENTLLDLPQTLLELGIVLKLKKLQVVTKILLKEAFPAILGNFTTVVIATIGYSAMAGVIGAGGLGSFAYTYGFQRNNQLAIWSSTILILVIVFIVEIVSKKIINKIDYR